MEGKDVLTSAEVWSSRRTIKESVMRRRTRFPFFSIEAVWILFYIHAIYILIENLYKKIFKMLGGTNLKKKKCLKN